MNRIEILKQNRQNLYDSAQRLLERAKTEKRDLTSTEETEYRGFIDEMDQMRARIEHVQNEERNDRNAENELRKLHNGRSARRASSEIGEEIREAILTRSNAPIEIVANDDEIRSGYQPGVERRDLSTSTASGLRGTTFWGSLVEHMVDSSAILSAGATVITTSTGEPLVIPKTSAHSTAAIVAEGAEIPESDPTFGKVTLGSFKYGFLVQVTRELAEDVSFDLEGYIAREVGIAIGNGFGAHAVTGTGTGQPRGILTDATLGKEAPAAGFGTQATAGEGGDLLIDLAASLAEPYQRSASAAWLMRNSTLAAIKKLKTSAGEYVFDSDVIPGSGSAGTLLGKPVYLDPTMPAIAAGAKSVLYGDVSRYWVRNVRSVRLDRSDEFAFDRDLITFRGLARLDGALIDTTGAVKYLQHAAA
ncbi:phage major capsid protein [Microbacterium sp. NPDC078428]|uniref:phage major capsid protein n=1 Tax=Microbacterium sp. NPDC078428 TaxID=3364190 RepID=UPI0037C5CF2F